ncbi:PAS/PAC sensor protein [Streptomyces viridochromogenes]|uniref:protein-serine/threonine phosphatase n=1 Tax=Streptomyces viridochromogenes TaxID=1938 RepID=A0A0J7ZPV5_STRVR|nr:SpoIIE family protein phosphatase [Streptomyces viridochromogenes]KMS77178.1 PAS/PAC sensor protein [Streptomyces viridochromogenes]KOG09422.1 PAS/PAC sensor protein [Streptomyces viridochromogenes]KOG27328.1 PAS/PAC sensor protein [Streptomyces viridochromogenes]
MADVVGEGAVERGTRRLRAEVALKTVVADPEAPQRLRRVLEQALVFSAATLAAVYAPGEDEDLLCLVESAGVPRTLYGLRDSYPRSGRSATADALRTGHPVWLGPAELAAGAESRRAPARDFFVAALPTPGAEDGGCLLAVSERPGGFDADDRACLALVAEAVAVPVRPAAAERGELPANAFSLAMDTGRVEVGDDILALFGLGPNAFDGKVETLLGLTVPEDLPSLMSVVEAGHTSLGDRELEFRVLQPAGPPRWLRLRGRLLPGGEGLPARLVGTVADASTLRAEVTDVARVQRLAAALAVAGTVRDVSHAVVTALRKPLRADRIALAELENDRLVVTVLDPPEPESWPELWRLEWRTEWPDAPVRAMPTLAAALREGRAQIWPAGTPLEPALADVGPGGLAVLPLPAGGRMAGACLIGWDAPHEFGPDERALLTASAGLAGQALSRAHAFDAEHELVGMLQRQLLPRRLPRLPGAEAVARYLPTTAGLEVGGDWYDVIPLPDNHVALVIGDVQGHSAAAATLMGQMRTALRAYAAEGHPPDVVVHHANRLLMDMETDLFATCCYVDVDLEEGTAWCVRAGHLPPVLRHPDGTTEIAEAEGGPPLGVLREADFPMSPIGLRPGTVVTLTTDGLVESADADIDTGMDRLARDLARSDPAHLGLVADALLVDARRSDDIALLLMRYDGMAVRPLRESWTVWRVPEAVGHARRFTRRTLRTWGVPPPGLDAVLLVVSELVTNALVHTDGRVRLDLILVNHRLRVAVADFSPRTPVKPASISWEATGGRGILLVEAMAAEWGTVPVSGGKQVWCEIALGG